MRTTVAAAKVLPEHQRANEEQACGETIAGYRMVDGARCLCGEAIKPGDLVKANFDLRRVHTGGGLYLVEEWRNGLLVWSGCRRMTRVPDGIAMDVDCAGDWKTFESIAPLQVVATVEGVYRDVFHG